ncbi:MAG: EthD family reductase [Anaerolineae bacterium]
MIVLYPQPADPAEFDRVYEAEHIPLCKESYPTMTSMVANKVVGSPMGAAPYYMIVEIEFPSTEALQEAMGTKANRNVGKHAVQISTGGMITVLLAESQTVQ